jgi:hypothetical protein
MFNQAATNLESASDRSAQQTEASKDLSTELFPSTNNARSDLQRQQRLQTTGNEPVTKEVPEFSNELKQLTKALDNTTTRNEYRSAGQGFSAPIPVKVWDKPGILAVLNSIPDEKKGQFIAHCADNKIDIPRIVGEVFSGGKLEIEQGQRALYGSNAETLAKSHGFDAKREAQFIHSCTHGFYNWFTDTKEIISVLTHRNSDQIKQLNKELYKLQNSGTADLSEVELAEKSKDTLFNTINKNFTGLDRIEGLKLIDRCQPNEAAKILRASSPQSLDILEIKRVLDLFTPEERRQVHDNFKGSGASTLTAMHEVKKHKSFIEFVRSFDPPNSDLAKACELFTKKDKPAEFIEQIKGMSPGERYRAEGQYNRYFSTTLSEVPSAATWKAADRPIAVGFLDAGRDKAAEKEGKANYVETKKPEPVTPTPTAEVKEEKTTADKSASVEATKPEAKATEVTPRDPFQPVTPAEHAKIPVPEPKAEYTVRYRDHERKLRVFDEKKLEDLVSKSFMKEVSEFARKSDYPAGWQMQIAHLVVEEALSKKNLSSGKVDLDYGDMKAAGIRVWKKMQQENFEHLVSAKDQAKTTPPGPGVSKGVVSGDKLETHTYGGHKVALDPVVAEHVFFGKFLSALEEKSTKKIDAYIEKMSADERLKLAQKISNWMDEDLTNEQFLSVAKAVKYLEHKAKDKDTSPADLFRTTAADEALLVLHQVRSKYDLDVNELSASVEPRDQFLLRFAKLGLGARNTAEVDSFIAPLSLVERMSLYQAIAEENKAELNPQQRKLIEAAMNYLQNKVNTKDNKWQTSPAKLMETLAA